MIEFFRKSKFMLEFFTVSVYLFCIKKFFYDYSIMHACEIPIQILYVIQIFSYSDKQKFMGSDLIVYLKQR